MCIFTDMRDLLPKEKPEALNFSWYVEDLLLAYKYDMKERYYQALDMLEDLLPKDLYRVLRRIGDNRICWRERR